MTQEETTWKTIFPAVKHEWLLTTGKYSEKSDSSQNNIRFLLTEAKV